MSDPKTTPAVPWGEDEVQLTEEELRDAILFAKHPGKPNFKIDGAILGLLEKGMVVAARMPDGSLDFRITQFGLEEDND